MLGNLDQIDFMYKDYKVLKVPAHEEYTTNGKRVWVKAKYRKISAPSDELKAEQRRILDEYLNKIEVHSSAYGFVQDKDIYDNARVHLNAHSLLEFDMKNFFDTITEEQVHTALVRVGFQEKLAKYITRVCTRFGTTPQGAPTSPALSNIICKPMDRKLSRLCNKNQCTYTRYADDITVSGHFDTLMELRPSIIKIVNSEGFNINGSKTRLLYKNRPQSVTGILVNAMPSHERKDISVSSRKSISSFKGILHRIEKEINEGTLHTFNELEQRYRSIDSLQGYANFIFRANPEKCSKYVEQVKRIRTLLKEKEMI